MRRFILFCNCRIIYKSKNFQLLHDYDTGISLKFSGRSLQIAKNNGLIMPQVVSFVKTSTMNKISFKLNGKHVEVVALDEMPLLWALRDLLKFTGTKYGCGIGFCGACTVHVNGAAVRACITPVKSCQDSQIETIEIEDSDLVNKIRKAWEELSVPQCGYCQPGQIMSAAHLLKLYPKPTEQDIDNFMTGNLCRCGTYPRIKKAILRISTNNEA